MSVSSQRCTFCGAELPPQTARCASCGNDVLNAPVAPQPALPPIVQGSASPGRKLGCVVGVLVLGLVLSSGVGFWLVIPTSEPAPVGAYGPSTVGVEIVEPTSAYEPPSPSSPEYYTLTINTSPLGADVLVDGRLLGASPVVLQRPARETPIIVEAQLEGFRRVRQRIVLQHDQILQLALERNSSPTVGVVTAPPSATPAVEPEAQLSDPPAGGGSITRSAVRRVMQRHANVIRRCYERSLLQNPDLAGRVTVQFTILATGSVTAAAIGSSTVNNSAMEQCILGEVSRLRFPSFGDGDSVTITYPFVFNSTGS